MDFEYRSKFEQKCIGCNQLIDFEDLWFDEKQKCKHNILNHVKIKYDCKYCKKYFPWYLLINNKEECKACIIEKIHKNNIEQNIEKSELWSVSKKISSYNYYDCKYFRNEELAKQYSKTININFEIKNLTLDLKLHVKNVECKGHWLYYHQDSNVCVDCLKDEYIECTSNSHCCCNNYLSLKY